MTELSNELKQLDWYYEYSDDHRVWSAGHDAYTTIVNKLAGLDDATVNTLIMNYVPTDRVTSLRYHIKIKRGDNKNA
jgi:hypothetical protein